MINYKDRIKGNKKRKPKVISFLNWKGGSTKTTTCCNLAYALSTMGYKILVIDADPQANSTYYFGILPKDMDLEKNFGKAICSGEDIRLHIRNTYCKSIDIVTSHPFQSNIELRISRMTLRELAFKTILKEVIIENYYDFILVDCNPYFGEVNNTIVYGSDYVIVPLECSTFGVFGIEYTDEYISRIKKEGRSSVEVLGIVMGRVDFSRGSIYKEIMKSVYNHYGEKTFKTYIPVDIKIVESQNHFKVLGLYDPKSRAAKVFITFAQEVLERIEK